MNTIPAPPPPDLDKRLRALTALALVLVETIDGLDDDERGALTRRVQAEALVRPDLTGAAAVYAVYAVGMALDRLTAVSNEVPAVGVDARAAHRNRINALTVRTRELAFALIRPGHPCVACLGAPCPISEIAPAVPGLSLCCDHAASAIVADVLAPTPGPDVRVVVIRPDAEAVATSG